MAVPDFQTLMLPTLQALNQGPELHVKEIRSLVSKILDLSAKDLEEMLPSGAQPLFDNRVAWALSHMSRAGLVLKAARGIYKLTDTGKSLLLKKPDRVDIKLLKTFPSYANWRKSEKVSAKVSPAVTQAGDTPEEVLQNAAQLLTEELQSDVLSRVRQADPSFLEKVVVDLLIGMGYGGGMPDRGTVVGKSGDGGIDGTIREDALGLDEVCVQAKKYSEDQTVGEPALCNFAGAIDAAATRTC